MAKSLKDLFLDKDYKVPFVEKPAKPENIVNSELNNNRPLLEFGKNLPKIYGTDLVRIESRGSIDPARTIAVNSARPNKGGFGKFLSNLLGQGGAYRPSDTIFPADVTSPPVSDGGQPVNGNWNTLKYSVEKGVDYIDVYDRSSTISLSTTPQPFQVYTFQNNNTPTQASAYLANTNFAWTAGTVDTTNRATWNKEKYTVIHTVRMSNAQIDENYPSGSSHDRTFFDLTLKIPSYSIIL